MVFALFRKSRGVLCWSNFEIGSRQTVGSAMDGSLLRGTDRRDALRCSGYKLGATTQLFRHSLIISQIKNHTIPGLRHAYKTETVGARGGNLQEFTERVTCERMTER